MFWKESKHLGGETYVEMRVLTKIQVNLVIPKGIFMVMFQPEGGDIYIGEFLT